ncbi:MAG: hypothetical protein AAFV59_15460, partial [Pseudomonadota bacterium]
NRAQKAAVADILPHAAMVFEHAIKRSPRGAEVPQERRDGEIPTVEVLFNVPGAQRQNMSISKDLSWFRNRSDMSVDHLLNRQLRLRA